MSEMQIEQAVMLVQRVYALHDMGGNLHCQLDDGNVENRFWREFVVYLPEDTSPEQEKVERECFATMKALTRRQRKKVLALFRAKVAQ